MLYITRCSGVFLCPSWTVDGVQNNTHNLADPSNLKTQAHGGGYAWPYAQNLAGGGGGQTQLLGHIDGNRIWYVTKPNEVTSPSETLVIGEANDHAAGDRNRATLLYPTDKPNGRHAGYTQMPISWADGHASVMNNNELTKNYDGNGTTANNSWGYYMMVRR